MRNECNIVRDILPLYVEDMVSQDTASFVEEHLESCTKCREELAELKKSTEIADMGRSVPVNYVNEAAPLKAVKKRLRRTQMLMILLSFVVTVILTGGVGFFIFYWGVPVTSENFELETEFQYSKYYYLNQEFVLHIRDMTGKPIGVSVESVYQTDANGQNAYDEYGNRICVGYEITVREIPFGIDPDNFTIGYGYDAGSPPDDDFDFTITVRFRDTTVSYSMTEEGLFVPQEYNRYF